jgi:polysaccharide export outer membrane protein
VTTNRHIPHIAKLIAAAAAGLLLAGCSSTGSFPSAESLGSAAPADYEYLIGPGDTLNVFVWRNPDVSAQQVPVRPDGRISTPLVEDIGAAGKTPNQLAREVESKLAAYIKDPLVTVTVTGFVGGYNEQIRVVGEATTPAAIPYRKNMTLLDVMLLVGGLTEFADGNDASVIRTVDGRQTQANVRLEDLMQNGDITANIEMLPGDILIIPEAWF